MGTAHGELLLSDLHDGGSEEAFWFVLTAFNLGMACQPAVQVP